MTALRVRGAIHRVIECEGREVVIVQLDGVSSRFGVSVPEGMSGLATGDLVHVVVSKAEPSDAAINAWLGPA